MGRFDSRMPAGEVWWSDAIRWGEMSRHVRRSSGVMSRENSMSTDKQIQRFLSGSPHAIVGASRNRAKYGNKVLRAFQQTGRPAFPVNPVADVVEGEKAYADLASLPEPVFGVSIITPPEVSEQIIEDVVRLGIKHVWFQPGAESDAAVRRAEQSGLNVIHGGPCILVALRYREG